MDKKKILIVDDETDVLSVLEKTLSTEGYSIITADNGNDAIMSAKSNHPDLIILDILMPDIDGAEVAARLKENPETKDIPVMFQTCLVSKDGDNEASRVIAGHVFVAKPYSMAALLTETKKLLLCND